VDVSVRLTFERKSSVSDVITGKVAKETGLNLSIEKNLFPAKNRTIRSYRGYISPTK